MEEEQIEVTELETTESTDAQEDIDGAYGEGANTFITKPVTLGDLKEVLNRIADYWAKTARLPTNLGTTTEETPRIWRSAS
jgi:response regulator RpfG family c-di-GMP phosphodiesterase